MFHSSGLFLWTLDIIPWTFFIMQGVHGGGHLLAKISGAKRLTSLPVLSQGPSLRRHFIWASIKSGSCSALSAHRSVAAHCMPSPIFFTPSTSPPMIPPFEAPGLGLCPGLGLGLLLDPGCCPGRLGATPGPALLFGPLFGTGLLRTGATGLMGATGWTGRRGSWGCSGCCLCWGGCCGCSRCCCGGGCCGS